MEAMLLCTLNEGLHKSDNVAQGTPKNKDSIQVELPSIKKHIPREFNSNTGSNHGWVPNGILFPKIEL
jgi:hypothetical protein